MLDSLLAFAALGDLDPAALATQEAYHRAVLSCDRLTGHWLQEDEYLALHTAIDDSRQRLAARRPMPFRAAEFSPRAADLTIGGVAYRGVDVERLTQHPDEADVREAYLVIRPHCLRLIGYF